MKPLFPGVIHDICRSSGASRQIADAGSAVIYQMAVTPVHEDLCTGNLCRGSHKP